MKKAVRITLVAILLLGSASVYTFADNGSDEKISLTLMESGTGNHGEIRQQELAELLKEDFPNVEIKVETYPEEQYYSILNTRLSMGDGPDFFRIQSNWAGPNAVQKLAPAGYLEPLDELSVVAEAPAALTDPVTYNGHVYSVSKSSMVLCTFYNKKIFEEQGLSVPQNWEEFLNICQSLKANGVTPIISGNKDGYALQFGLYQIAACQIYADNPDYNQQLENQAVKFTDPGAWANVIDRYMLLYDNGYVQEHSLSVSSAEALQRFASGDAAMLFGGNFNYSALAESMDEDELGAFPLPANEEGEPVYGVISNGGGIAVYAEGSHTALCKEIFEKIYSAESAEDNSGDEEFWAAFEPLLASGCYTINCNQGWKGDVEWVLENEVSKKISGEALSSGYIAVQMQNAYEEG